MSEVLFLQHTREGALYAVPPAGLGVGDVVKSAKPVSPDHEIKGEVLSVAKNGLAIVCWPTKRQRENIRKHPTNDPAATPTVATTRRQVMSEIEKMTKAARTGLHEYGNKRDWHGAIEQLAKAEQGNSETLEQAYARVVREHPDGRAMRDCYEKAAPAAPKAPKPEPVEKSPAEQRLDELAKSYADENGVTFEQGFAAVIETDEGRELRKQVA